VMWGAIVLGLVASVALRRWRWPIAIGFLLAAAIHLIRIWPYVPIAAEQLALGQGRQDDSCFSALALNVKMDNFEYSRVADMIEVESPDVLLLMETNAAWTRALARALATYPYRLTRPLDNYYGMTFASRVPVVNARIVSNTSSNTPTLYATLKPPDGSQVEFIGLHPRPPIPGQSTRSRDENIARAGALTPDGLSDVFVMGDFNDVPWSRTTRGFARDGGYKDPRIGRGTYPTFPAGQTWLGWPLDQVMVKGALSVKSFSVLEKVGSDHRPVKIILCQRTRSE